MIQTKIIDLLFASGTLVLLLGSFLGMYTPQMQHLAQLHTQAHTLQQHLETGAQLSLGLNHMHAEIAAIQRRLADFDQQLPREAQLDSFLRQIDQAASQTDFKITMIKPGSIQHEELYSQIAMTIMAESRFPEFYGFLAALAAMPRLTKIADLLVVRKTNSNICDITLTLFIYTAKATSAA